MILSPIPRDLWAHYTSKFLSATPCSPGDLTSYSVLDPSTRKCFSCNIWCYSLSAICVNVIDRTCYRFAENNQSAAPTVTKTITFTRDKVNNLALNKVTYTPWMVDGKEVVAASFAAVISPEIKGYTADLKEVAAITVTPTDENKAYVTTVKYTKNPTLAQLTGYFQHRHN